MEHEIYPLMKNISKFLAALDACGYFIQMDQLKKRNIEQNISDRILSGYRLTELSRKYFKEGAPLAIKINYPYEGCRVSLNMNLKVYPNQQIDLQKTVLEVRDLPGGIHVNIGIQELLPSIVQVHRFVENLKSAKYLNMRWAKAAKHQVESAKQTSRRSIG
ncbi:hypothetical protein [[Flexibacter] sp. ATCC 35208]|uniref:hypothetical protein n=1 Tax=[Flexibacter] sp. ATCC 35208 TaxID=1936242 RepID=UPI0009CAD8DF|nr:hypothetical protein [[Flexibacter] sp. ATCC 35208]OMP80074.1 hypothetical protein BW716_06165 [[Flexibacter] sp. ATCC 35208]